MQMDLETIIVLLIVAVVFWNEWKMLTEINFAKGELIEFVQRRSVGFEKAGSEEPEQVETGLAGWDSLPDFF